MAWSTVTTLNLTIDWQFTEPVVGTFFRFAHENAPASGVFEIAQVESNQDGTYTIFDSQILTPEREMIDIIRLNKPGVIDSRRLALRRIPARPTLEQEIRRLLLPGYLQPADSTPTIARNRWQVTIEKSDVTEQTTVDLSEILSKLDEISDQIEALQDGSGGGSDPSDFPTTVRFRISATGASFSDGALVESLTDLSGNNYTCTATGTARPTYKTNIINSKSAILFNGTQQYLDLGNQQLIPDTGNFIVIVVVRPVASSTIWSGSGDGGSSWGIRDQTNIAYVISNSNLVSADHGDLEANNNYIVCWGRVNGEFISHINIETVNAGANSGTIRGGVNGWIRRVMVGANYKDGVIEEYYSGYISDFCIKLDATKADINSIGSYYATEYNVSWTTLI